MTVESTGTPNLSKHNNIVISPISHTLWGILWHLLAYGSILERTVALWGMLEHTEYFEAYLNNLERFGAFLNILLLSGAFPLYFI